MQQEKLAATRELWAGQGSVAQLHCMQAAHTPIAYPIEPGIIGARNPKKSPFNLINKSNKQTHGDKEAGSSILCPIKDTKKERKLSKRLFRNILRFKKRTVKFS